MNFLGTECGQVPSGGPKPRNTLHTDPIYQRSHLHETTRSRSRGGETPQLVLQASRGANVAPSLRTADSREAWAVSSPKRQKIVHQANSPSSGNSTDELLDQQNPENVTFGPSRRSSQAVSIPSFNSQASNLQTRSNGPITRLPEYHSVERTMNSSGPTRKQKRREASQNGQRSNGLPVSPEPPSLSQSTELIELDGGKNIDDSELDRAPEGSYLDVVRKLSSSIDAPKAKLSKAIPVPADKKTSPFFPQPTLPPRPSNGTQGHHSNIQRSQNSKQKHSDKLDEQFRSTNGSRRSLDYNMSSDADELQMGTTVGKYTDINRSRNFSPSKGSSSTLKATSPTQDTGLEPSNIKSSDFASVKPKAQSDSRFSGPSIREKSTPWFADVAAVSIGGEKVTWNAMALVFVERDSNYVLKMDGKTTDIQILPQKLVKILWEASGRKIRLMSSKQGVEDGIVDLEFCKEKDVSRLITKLKTQPGCTTTSVPRCVPLLKMRKACAQIDWL